MAAGISVSGNPDHRIAAAEQQPETEEDRSRTDAGRWGDDQGPTSSVRPTCKMTIQKAETPEKAPGAAEDKRSSRQKEQLSQAVVCRSKKVNIY